MQSDKIMEEICSIWNLPKNYIEFLNNHQDNIYVNMNDDEDDDEDFFSYENEIEVYGAENLIVGQHGYSYNPIEKAVIEDWNSHYVVIANCNADPYCIDITLEHSPVYYAEHGVGKWEFTKDSESLEEFFEFLGIC